MRKEPVTVVDYILRVTTIGSKTKARVLQPSECQISNSFLIGELCMRFSKEPEELEKWLKK